jgi:hypothetical protein
VATVDESITVKVRQPIKAGRLLQADLQDHSTTRYELDSRKAGGADKQVLAIKAAKADGLECRL